MYYAGDNDFGSDPDLSFPNPEEGWRTVGERNRRWEKPGGP